ncbi:MAG TPA: hypothetical protein VMX16_01170 [Terriglobia bacterium]|nr:hypothetical protein [Terriglobia bacterium]
MTAVVYNGPMRAHSQNPRGGGGTFAVAALYARRKPLKILVRRS